MTWDVFVSHASEDKDAIARPLSEALSKLGLKVWFDEFQLKIGDSLSESIDNGLAKSSYGIVVVSKAFFDKNWTAHELRGLTSRFVAKQSKILPVWHHISFEEVAAVSPTLADIYSYDSRLPIERLAINILGIVKPLAHRAIMRKVTAEAEINAAAVLEIDPREIAISDIRHEWLPESFVRRVKFVMHTLREVDPGSLEKWVEGFQRDSRPSDELEVWEQICERYINICEPNDLDVDTKRKIFGFLLSASICGQVQLEGLMSKIEDSTLQIIRERFVRPLSFSAKINDHLHDNWHDRLGEKFENRRDGEDPDYIKAIISLLKK